MTIVRSRSHSSAGAEINRRNAWEAKNDLKWRRKRAGKKQRRKAKIARLHGYRDKNAENRVRAAQVRSMPAPAPRPTTRDDG